MNVGELKDLLEHYEDDCEVIMVGQESWPFEYQIAGVTDRMSCGDPDYDDNEDSGAATDVFIVEGGQLRYGTRKAWESLL